MQLLQRWLTAFVTEVAHICSPETTSDCQGNLVTRSTCTFDGHDHILFVQFIILLCHNSKKLFSTTRLTLQLLASAILYAREFNSSALDRKLNLNINALPFSCQDQWQ